MLFNSVEFIAFFVAVVAVYFALPHRFRWMFLLATSYFFYACWNRPYVLLLLATTLLTYVAGRFLEQSSNKAQRKWCVAGFLTLAVGTLFVFKYYNFFTSQLNAVLGLSIPVSKLLLPVGISFYLFQAMSYVLDVYWGRHKADSLKTVALYLAFFPKLAAGPIDRAGDLAPQFDEVHRFEYDRVVGGLRLMLWGAFKKIVIADRLAMIVDLVYGDPTSHTGLALTLATLAYTFQIYADFSAYTDVARGTAQVLGFRLIENFRQPYFATSTNDFWRRWHMSLSFWFRDYLYIPLGGNRVSVPRWALNIVVVFLVCGLWHGSNWTFVVWGGLHGLYIVGGRFTKPVRDKLADIIGLNRVPVARQVIQTVITFSLVSFAWLFFRAKNMETGWYIASHLFSGWYFDPEFLKGLMVSLSLAQGEWIVVLATLALLVLVDVGHLRKDAFAWFAQRPIWFRWAVYCGLAWGIFVLGIFGKTEFIYVTF